MLFVRLAESEDLPRISEIHSRSWETAYRGMLPGDFLDGVRTRHHLQWASLPSAGYIFVAVEADEADEVCGFACVLAGEDRHGKYLLDNLHTDPLRRSSGIGRRLLREVLDVGALHDPGGILYLWVIEANVRGRQFYKREGGTEGETRIEVFAPGVEVLERKVWWSV